MTEHSPSPSLCCVCTVRDRKGRQENESLNERGGGAKKQFRLLLSLFSFFSPSFCLAFFSASVFLTVQEEKIKRERRRGGQKKAKLTVNA